MRVGTADVYRIGVVDYPVKYGIRQRVRKTAQLLVPFRGRVLRAENRGRFPATPMQDFEDGLLFAFAGFQQQPFVDNQQRRFRVLQHRLREGPVFAGHLQFYQQIRQTYEFRVVELATRLVTESAGHEGLAAARGPGDEDVAAFANELAGSEPGNQIPVQFPARRVVDFVDIGSFLLKPGTFHEPVQGVVLALAIFDIHKQAETVVERNA